MILHTIEDSGRYITTLQINNYVTSGIASTLKESQSKAFGKYLNEYYPNKILVLSTDALNNRHKQRLRKLKTTNND